MVYDMDSEKNQAWQKARELTREIYLISNYGKFSRDIDLCSKTRQASVALMSCIADVYKVKGYTGRDEFLEDAKSLLDEVKSRLSIAIAEDYISKKTYKKLLDLSEETDCMIDGIKTDQGEIIAQTCK